MYIKFAKVGLIGIQRMTVTKRHTLWIALLILSLLTLSNCSFQPVDHLLEKKAVVETRTAERNYRYEIAENFLALYNSVDDPESFFGKPISHAYTNPNNGNLTQYFENLRLELQKDEYGRISVAVSNLGSQLYDPAGKEMQRIDINCTHYGNNEFPVCNGIRDFYDQHNGQILFGEPISNVFKQNGRFYQYFANVCVVWDPVLNTASLTPIGETYLTSREPLRYTIIDSSYPELMIVDNESPEELTVLYSVEHPFINPNWEQTVTIYVTDENGNPIEGATVAAWVILPNEHYEIYRPADTNQDGISTFNIPELASSGVEHNDIIQLQIEVNANGQFGQIVGWFRIWL